MQSHDRARIGKEDLDRTYEEERETAAARRAEIDARTRELDAELGRQEGERGETAGSIDAGIRNEYDRVSGGRTTQALAPVVEGCCGHCYTAIPMQRQAEIRAGAKLIVCEGCGVILHAER
jgi:predicted  nucleic acid-binding Zn-ribbon protein